MRTAVHVLLEVAVLSALLLGVVGGALGYVYEQDTVPEVTVENDNETTNRAIVYTIDEMSSTDLLMKKDGEYQQLEWNELYLSSSYDLIVPEYEGVTRQQAVLQPNSETTMILDDWEQGDSIVYFVKVDGQMYWWATHCDEPDQTVTVTIKAEGAKLSGEGCTP